MFCKGHLSSNEPPSGASNATAAVQRDPTAAPGAFVVGMSDLF